MYSFYRELISLSCRKEPYRVVAFVHALVCTPHDRCITCDTEQQHPHGCFSC